MKCRFSSPGMPKTYFTSSADVTGVDFRRGEDGQGRVIISVDRAGANISIEEGAGVVNLDIFNANLPDRLRQRLDVVDFATPVNLIDATRMNNGVRIAMTVTGVYEHMVYQTGQDIIVEVTKPRHITAGAEEAAVKFFEDKEYTGERVTFNFQNIPVRSVLQLIADVSDLNIVVADSVGGNLTLRLTNVPWDQALDIVMDARNLDKRENGNVIWIAPTQEIANREQQLLKAQLDRRILEPLQTVLIRMSYSKALDMKELIDESTNAIDTEFGLLSERGSVTVDERTNTLLITDTADRIVEIRELMTALDYAVRQVQIESRIVIANSDFAHELGVRFGTTLLHQGKNIGVIAADGRVADAINPRIDPTELGLIDYAGYPTRYQVNLPAPDQNAATIGFSFLTSNVLLDLELSALESEGQGEVISTPRVVNPGSCGWPGSLPRSCLVPAACRARRVPREWRNARRYWCAAGAATPGRSIPARRHPRACSCGLPIASPIWRTISRTPCGPTFSAPPTYPRRPGGSSVNPVHRGSRR